MNSKKLILHVQGMHCKACILLTEMEAKELSYIARAKSDLSHHTIEVEGDFGNKSSELIAQELTEVMQSHGYTVSVEKKLQPKRWAEFTWAIPIAVAFAILFVALQKLGIVNLIQGGKVTYGTAFVIGIVASLSTCMVVVGGLVLSMSATFAQEGDTVRPQLMFHLGRIISFFILGGVIGAIGTAFTLNTTATVVLGLIIAAVMLVLGLNLLEVFPWAKKLQPSMPKFLARHAYGASKLNHTLTPLLVGVATFFLPCGFTQSMQIYTLSTGSFLNGALTMGAFALGTLPVLGLLSFSSFSIQNSSYSGIFFKTAGLIVILFALFNLLNILVIIGLVSPLFNF